MTNIKREVEEAGDEDLRIFLDKNIADVKSSNEVLKQYRRWEDPNACQLEIDRNEEELKEYLDSHPCYEFSGSEKIALDGIADTIALKDDTLACLVYPSSLNSSKFQSLIFEQRKIEETMATSLGIIRSCARRYQERAQILKKVVASEEQGKRIEVVVSSGEESSKSDEEEDEEGTMNQSNEKEGFIAGKEDEKDDKEGGLEVDASIEEEAQTSRHGETAGAGAECQVPQQAPANQTSPLERTLTSMTPAEDEGQALAS